MSPISGGTPGGLPGLTGDISDIQWILSVAYQQLQDVAGVTWQLNSLGGYLNMAIHEIVTLQPHAYSQTQLKVLIAGVRQPLSNTILDLLDVTFNMGITGVVRGNAIISIPKGQMDYLLPDWATYPASDIVQYAIIDDRDPQTFFIFPPQPDPANGQQVELLVSVMPDMITDVDNDVFPLDASYKVACVDYIVGRALMEENTIPNAQAKGQIFLQKFMQDIGLKANIQKGEIIKGK